jgi:hypothetical protein
MPVAAIGNDTGKRPEKENRALTREGDETEQKRGIGQPIDQPAHGHLLHPGANQRNTLADCEKTEIAMAQRPQSETEPVQAAASVLWTGQVFSATVAAIMATSGWVVH